MRNRDSVENRKIAQRIYGDAREGVYGGEVELAKKLALLSTETLEKQSAAGDRVAQFVLGVRHLDGETDSPQAGASGEVLLVSAAEKGCRLSRAFLLLRELGQLCQESEFLKKPIHQAVAAMFFKEDDATAPHPALKPLPTGPIMKVQKG